MAAKGSKYICFEKEKLDLKKGFIWFPFSPKKKYHLVTSIEYWMQEFPSGDKCQYQGKYNEYHAFCGATIKESLNHDRTKEGRLIETRGRLEADFICPVCQAYFEGFLAGTLAYRKKKAETFAQKEKALLPEGETPWYDQ